MDIQSMKVQRQFAKPEVTEKQLRSVCAERSCFYFAEALFSFCKYERHASGSPMKKAGTQSVTERFSAAVSG